jgi:integrase
VTWHHLRHTFASHLLDQGFDILFVSKQLGHSSADVTWKVYGHLVKEEEKLEKARISFDGFALGVAV